MPANSKRRSILRRAVVRAVGPARVGGVDPATRTFQALRIAVNHELEELSTLLESAPSMLAPGAPLVIISFHSLEDRQVKRAFLEPHVWQRLTNKPIVPSRAETEPNPRSRSAKLRAAPRRWPREEPAPLLDSVDLGGGGHRGGVRPAFALRGRNVELGYELGKARGRARAAARGEAGARARRRRATKPRSASRSWRARCSACSHPPPIASSP